MKNKVIKYLLMIVALLLLRYIYVIKMGVPFFQLVFVCSSISFLSIIIIWDRFRESKLKRK
ncbi:MAG: hypothetical protein ACOWWH_12945 [Eubacteriaceae bacterium]